MHKDEWSRIIIMCISSASECGMFWEKPGSRPVSACSHPTEHEGIYLLVVSVPVLSVEVWTQESLAEGFR